MSGLVTGLAGPTELAGRRRLGDQFLHRVGRRLAVGRSLLRTRIVHRMRGPILGHPLEVGGRQCGSTQIFHVAIVFVGLVVENRLHAGDSEIKRTGQVTGRRRQRSDAVNGVITRSWRHATRIQRTARNRDGIGHIPDFIEAELRSSQGKRLSCESHSDTARDDATIA